MFSRLVRAGLLKRSFSTSSAFPRAVELNHTVIPCLSGAADAPKVIILHGLLGSLANWRTLSRNPLLTQNYTVVTADLRNHGASPHSTDMSYEANSADIACLIEKIRHNNEPVTVVGHSLGGKFAAAAALNYPDLVSRLVLVDILPLEYESVFSGVFKILRSLQTVPIHTMKTRQEVDQYLETLFPDKGLRSFLLMNLAFDGDRLYWRAAVDTLVDSYETIRRFDADTHTVFTGKTLVIRGTKSPYVDPDTQEDIMAKQFSDVEFTSIEAGHWVHDEKPAEFLNILSTFLNK